MRPTSVQVEGLSRGDFTSIENQHIEDLFARTARFTLERPAKEGDTDLVDWFLKGDARSITIEVPDGFKGHIPANQRVTIKRAIPDLMALNRPEIPGSSIMERIGVWFLLADVEREVPRP